MLKRYLHRLYDTVISRGYVEIERLDFDDFLNHQGFIEGRLKFHDGSLLDFDEVILLLNEEIVKVRYAYHYQNELGELIFRYDNAPHHPNVFTYPHHKHTGSTVAPSEAPDLSEVLQEIDQLIFIP